MAIEYLAYADVGFSGINVMSGGIPLPLFAEPGVESVVFGRNAQIGTEFEVRHVDLKTELVLPYGRVVHSPDRLQSKTIVLKAECITHVPVETGAVKIPGEGL